jgi:hypothetical protein
MEEAQDAICLKSTGFAMRLVMVMGMTIMVN